jgi:hypothetical protein
MDGLKLQCSMQRCNVDGTTEMKIEKCVLTNASPCYYLMIKVNDEDRPEDVWKKFNNFVADKSKRL